MFKILPINSIGEIKGSTQQRDAATCYCFGTVNVSEDRTSPNTRR